jgi:hypothetical protein
MPVINTQGPRDADAGSPARRYRFRKGLGRSCSPIQPGFDFLDGDVQIGLQDIRIALGNVERV